MDESYDPLRNPSVRDLCREDPGIEQALRARYPAAGGGDQDWSAATDERVRREANRARLLAARDRMIAREIAAMTMYLLASVDSDEGGPEGEVPPLLIADDRLN